MQASTTIEQMLTGNKIFVPTYQRAYSWETEIDNSKPPKQVNVFLSDLDEYNNSSTKTPYYFGHFLYEEKSNNKFGVIDGQQRLTTIIIFLSVVFKHLKSIRKLTQEESAIFNNIIKSNLTYQFTTVDYDNQLFKDYVIDQTKRDKNGIDTQSAWRIVNALDFFDNKLKTEDEKFLLKMLESVKKSSCTTHSVIDESEAIQMFLFQNSRGKKPSNLEIIKAQFMFHINLHGDEEKENLIDEIKNRFEKIYKSISLIDYRIDEDDVLVYTLRVYFNSLWETNAIDKINKLLVEKDAISFIKSFTHALSTSFEYLTIFFGKDEREINEIHSIVTLGRITIAIPFIIKAYKFGISRNELKRLCVALESLVLRHRLIGTRADMTSRINWAFSQFIEDNTSIEPIIERLHYMKTTTDGWWDYWNTEALKNSIQGGIEPSTAKFILWKYEHYLDSKGKAGYIRRFDQIEKPELEHIAPQTPTNGTPVAAGYPDYDDDFKQNYLNCLGNYLLISKSHNGSIGNIPFIKKRESYEYLAQQREIKQITIDKRKWSKTLIKQRKKEIIDFILETF